MILSLSSPALVTERGGPAVPSGVLVELRKIDPALGLRWIANFDQSKWAVTWEWKLSDPRWSRVQSQDIPRESAYDILGYLPVDCSTDEARPYIEAHLKNYPKEEISKLRAKMSQWNDVDVPKAQISEIVTDALDGVSRDSRAPKGQQFFGSASLVR